MPNKVGVCRSSWNDNVAFVIVRLCNKNWDIQSQNLTPHSPHVDYPCWKRKPETREFHGSEFN